MIRTRFMFKPYYELSNSEKMVLAYICSKVEEGRYVITNMEIATAGMSTKTVDRAIAVLLDLGLIGYMAYKNTKTYDIPEEVLNDVLVRSKQ